MEPRPHERGKGQMNDPDWIVPFGFNGATSSRTWKAVAFAWVDGARLSASMEPRPHERGK